MTETTRTTKDTAIMIKVSNLYPHPDNPRKDLGDLTDKEGGVRLWNY